MKISTVIITKDRPEMLHRCLNSFTIQTEMPYEIIIVDSSAGSATKETVASFNGKLPIHYLYQPQKGYSIARNTGINYAGGDIIAFTDDDCIVDQNWVANILHAHNKFTHAAGIGGKINSPKNANCIMRLAEWRNSISFDNFIKKNDFYNIYNINCSYKKEYLDKVGQFDEAIIKEGEDTDLNWRLCQKGYKVMYLPEIQVIHFQRSTFKSFMKQRFAYIKASYVVSRKHPDFPVPCRDKIFFLFFKIFKVKI